MEEVNAYIVDDRVIKYSVLIGHSFTEKPGIVITKTTHSLIFTRDQSVKLELNLKTDILIPPKEMYLLPCFSTNKYSGMVHVSGSLRGTPQNEYYLMPGDYDMENGEVRILVQSFSNSAVCLKMHTLITRVLCTRNNLSINLLDFDNAETMAAFNCGQQLRKIEKQQDYAKKHFDKRRKSRTTYNVGDLVRLERTVIDKDHVGKSHKLIPKFQGPYRILKLLPNDRFLVEDTPITRKGNKRYENVVALDKIHPWMNFKGYASESTDSDQSEGTEIELDRE
ncbi:hypothetical protein SFRURICE_015646 [Spodoptera frugiperda]|nr:hypothetical protein SFRURICE_015646 [Spodoptera frugiperda]